MYLPLVQEKRWFYLLLPPAPPLHPHLPPATPTLTLAEEFTSRANGICSEANGQVLALGTLTENQISFQVEATGTYQEIADYFESFLTIEATALDQLKTLPPPGGEAEFFGEFLTNLEQSIELSRSYAAALRAEDITEFKDLIVRGHAIEAEMSFNAGQAGLRQCMFMGIP